MIPAPAPADMLVLIPTASFIPERAVNAAMLAEELDAVVVHDQERSAVETFITACDIAGDDGCIIVEDDVTPCRFWRRNITAAIAQRPSEVIRFFGWEAGQVEGYRPGSSFQGNQCVYLPPGLPSYLVRNHEALYAAAPKGSYHAPDLIVNRALVTLRRTWWNHLPHLVQHKPFKSAFFTSIKQRQTSYFIDDFSVPTAMSARASRG